MSLLAQFEGKWPHEKTVQIRVVSKMCDRKKVPQLKQQLRYFGSEKTGAVRSSVTDVTVFNR